MTDEDLIEIRDLILSNKVAAPARANAIAPNDVIIPPQNTGLGPEKTSFFQALSIPTKISRGAIEIVVSWCENCLTDKLFLTCYTYLIYINQLTQFFLMICNCKYY